MLSLLAEAIFAYIDELSADSVEGYAEAQAEVGGPARRRLRQRARRAAGPRAAGRAEAELRAAAGRGGLDARRARVAALACAEGELGAIARRAAAPARSPTAIEGIGCLLLADPAGPGRGAEIERAAAGRAGGARARRERSPACRRPGRWPAPLCAPSRPVRCPSDGLLVVEDHLADLVVLRSGERRGADRRRGAWRRSRALTEKAGSEMRATALAYVRHGGNSVAMAAELHVHPQTAATGSPACASCSASSSTTPTPASSCELALRAQGAQRRRRRGSVRKTTSQSGEETPKPKRWSWK